MSDRARPRDPELTGLLLEELRRHALTLTADGSPASARYVLHALKGSAALAGERSLSDAIARIEGRIAAGDESALERARALLAAAERALSSGAPLPIAQWPEPPDDLRASPLDPQLAVRYATEMHDRLARVDRALAADGPDAQASLASFREVHAMKGAALAVADEVTAWFCHGLEERLREGERSEEAGRRALAELTRWRGVLSEMIVAPERALETLRTLARPARLPSIAPLVGPLPLPPRRPSIAPASEAEPRSQVDGEATLRVPTATLDRLFERVRQFGQARTQVSDGADLVWSTARRARSLRTGLSEALRLIGPPRPWGAPAAAIKRIEEAAREIGGFAEQLEREALELKEAADRVRIESAAAHRDLAAMRSTTVAWLFERVSAAVTAEARREGGEVRVVSTGEQTAIERRVAEMLFDPILQLARNAVAHGIESAPERALRRKPRVGTIRLAAEPRSGGLRLVVQDDGAGVDVADVRLRAIARGTISAEMARAADDQTLLALLFVPGFTTRDSADLLAGRGVGLDLALEAVHRLGGTIRLASQAGMGVTATLDIPFEPGLIKVLWIEAAGVTYALPVQRVRRILLGRDAADAVPLDRCVRGPGASSVDESRGVARPQSALAIELDPLRDGGEAPMFGIDRVGRIEEVALRGVSALIATAGPYAGAIVRGSELRLCLDAHALAERIGTSA